MSILTKSEIEKLMYILEKRFNANMNRHQEIEWTTVKNIILLNTDVIFALSEMERTGGEPDLVVFKNETTDFQIDQNSYIFIDCSIESPIGRRSLCYDQKALNNRKKNKPVDGVENLATMMKVTLLDEITYRKLQNLFPLDLKSSSWIKTPDKIRQFGGALFCEYRYGQTFTYHNSAESYYASRGFRAMVTLEF